jgi:hypothetical protein
VAEQLPNNRNALPPSVASCECLDGPYAGHVVRVGVRAAFVDVRDLHDASKPRERYRIDELDGQKVLRWAPASRGLGAPPSLISVRIFCTHCGDHTVTDHVTGRRVDMVAQLGATDLADVEQNVASLRCVECDGPMDVKVLEDQ